MRITVRQGKDFWGRDEKMLNLFHMIDRLIYYIINYIDKFYNNINNNIILITNLKSDKIADC